MTGDEFREMILSMPGAAEGSHMGHPDFRANGRIFASLRSGDRLGMVKLTPGEQRACMRDAPGTFEPSSGAWGRQGCTDVLLAAARPAAVRAAVLLAFEGVMAQPPAKARSKKPAAPKRRKPSTTTRARR
jgi:hypothetical protein